jgi:hypothetical protein
MWLEGSVSLGWRGHGSRQWRAEKLPGAGDAGGVAARPSARLRVRERGMVVAGWGQQGSGGC